MLAVPAYREHPDCVAALLPAFRDAPSLLIAVINRPDSDPDTTWAMPWLNRYQPATDSAAPLHHIGHRGELLLIDRAVGGEPLPADQGVGLARKIGADIACQLIADGRVRSPWIHTTDADAALPRDYFRALADATPEHAACIYPFRHRDSAAGRADWPIRLYEWHIRYYAAGLRGAGSPWGFTTIGSTLAINHRHYALARGFPRRAAAEDFYLLNKLAKLGDIRQLQAPPLTLSARHSDRVPFGTGRAGARIAALAHPGDFLSYNPACFEALATGIQWLSALGNGSAATGDADPLIRAYLQERPLPARLLAQPPGEQKRRQLRDWFDAFRTLKFIHFLRRHHYPDLPVADILASGPKWLDEPLRRLGESALNPDKIR